MPRAERPPQSYELMVSEGQNKKGSRIYKAESGKYTDGRITALVYASVEELSKAADTMERVSLADTQTIKERAIMYTRACGDSSSLPTFSGFMRSLGMSAQAGYNYMNRNPDSPSGKFLQMYSDYCGDVLAEAALHGLTNPVFSIFVEKSRNGWRDVVTVETIQNDPLGTAAITAEEVAAKYADLPGD